MNYHTLLGILLTNPNPMTASEVMIAGRMRVQSGTVAVHLRMLRQMGIVATVRKGKRTAYLLTRLGQIFAQSLLRESA